MHKDDVCIELFPGMFICQLYIGKLTSTCITPYKGKYLNQEEPTVYRP